MAASEGEIDDSLYSRQRYVLGDTAMHRMAQSNVLLYGMGGLGVEIAKNIVLAGIKSLTMQDNAVATYHDLGTQFFLREEDIKSGKNRAAACATRVEELNPYVSIKTLTAPLNEETCLDYLKEFQCVILTEAPLSVQRRVNSFCRAQTPPIKFVMGDVYGVFCWTFCDFGDQFEVLDSNGEEPKEVFISKVTKENPGLVTTLENKMHGFESGDTVTFKEVKGMTALNGKQFPVKVTSPYSFKITDTTGEEFQPYTNGGCVVQVKMPQMVHFDSLERQLCNPALLIADFAKWDAPANTHLGMIALHRFREKNSRLPNIRCSNDAEEMRRLAAEANGQMESKVEKLDDHLIGQLSVTCQGCFAPLCGALGGIVAQEALKGLTGKFSPLKQWLYLDATEVVAGLDDANAMGFQPRQTRYDALRACIGEDLCRKLADLHVFMVGCGAIGCEMLKNYATLGVATSEKGLITVTDNDLIEKSNLNRQFLFRPRHIRKPKSSTGAASAKEINPDLKVDAHQYKACPQTENVYSDAFLESQDVVVNALDNVEARRYMDSRCVTSQRALLESGTMAAKGHVQVIVPHLSESYATQRDPPDEDVPYCTLKSFPAVIEHCIQWSRDKFESSFAHKPSLFNKFWSCHSSLEDVIQKLSASTPLEGGVIVSKLAARRPRRWADCVTLARNKFEKYFNHRAKHLLHAFPMDTKLKDGSLFWQSPKRPPTPLIFDGHDPLHAAFLVSCARLYADVCAVQYSAEDLELKHMLSIVATVKVPDFSPGRKNIVTDESAKKPVEDDEMSGDELLDSAARLSHVQSHGDGGLTNMAPAYFEKDDDSNGHIDFITAASNLRAVMYDIEPADRLKTKRIAGRIIPAIATTTAAVAGLVSLELVKLVRKLPLEHYRNCFLNLGLPVFLFSEPGAAVKSTMSNGMTFTLWDRWEIQGRESFTLQDLLNAVKEKYGVEATMVIHGAKMVYVPIMPLHRKRLPQKMTKLMKPPADKSYVDLVVGYGDEDDPGPIVRYHFGLS